MNREVSYSPGLLNLIRELKKLPGLGYKSAARIAFHILNMKQEEALSLSEAIRLFRLNTSPCTRCGFPLDEPHCFFCDNPKRDKLQICIVEKAQDILSIEKTAVYRGQYHSLGGVLSPLDGIEINDLRFQELLQRVQVGNFREAILAISPTMQGEATALYIGEKLKEHGIRTLRLSLGLPVGTDLEFADSLTLSRAITSRTEF
jgi:recombination protein RecR